MIVEIELVEIRGLKDNKAIVVFREKDGQRFGAIEMAGDDAVCVQYGVERRRGPQPGSHDVIQDTLLAAGITVERFIIRTTDDKGVIGAELAYNQGGHRFTVDCRSSDGFAIAIRMDAPLFCEEQVLELMDAYFRRVYGLKDDTARWLQYFTEKGDDIPKS